MKKIVCELCDCTEFTKDGGMFVCNSCGTKYSAEEAKALMKEVEGDAPAVGAPAGMPQANPNQQQIENLLVLASNAFESANNEETESYCNKVIELDVTCYKAWLLKGQAIGWQSQYGNPRVQEGANAMRKAYDFAPEEEKVDVAKQAITAIGRICDALCNLAKQNFSQNPTQDNRLKFGEFVRLFSESTRLFMDVSDEIRRLQSDEFDNHKRYAAEQMNYAGVGACNFVREKWNGIEYPNHDSWNTYLDWFEEIRMMFDDSIKWGTEVNEDDEEIITRHKNRIIALEEPIDSCSYKQQWNSYYSRYDWVRDYFLTDAAKNNRRNMVKESNDAIKKIQNKAKEKEAAERKKAEEEKKARIAAYWEAHAEEKARLDVEKKELSEKKKKIDEEIAAIDKEIKAAEAPNKTKFPSEVEIDKIKEQKRELENKRAGLGLFAGKEKKQIGEEIAALDGRVSALNNKLQEEKKAKAEEIKNKVAPLKTKKDELSKELSKVTKRISAIDAELTKDPEEKQSVST